MYCSIYIAKTKPLIICAVTAPLFSHDQEAVFLIMRLIIFFVNSRFKIK